MPARIQNITLLLMIVFILGYGTSCTAWAFKDKNEVRKTWIISKYKVNLVYNQGWAGPANYQYILYKKGLLKKRIGISYSGMDQNDDSCLIKFKPGDGFVGADNYSFDKCTNEIKPLLPK